MYLCPHFAAPESVFSEIVIFKEICDTRAHYAVASPKDSHGKKSAVQETSWENRDVEKACGDEAKNRFQDVREKKETNKKAGG